MQFSRSEVEVMQAAASTGKETSLMTSTVVLTKRQIMVLRQISGLRTARGASNSRNTHHSVSSVLRELLEQALPRLEAELKQVGPGIGAVVAAGDQDARSE